MEIKGKYNNQNSIKKKKQPIIINNNKKLVLQNEVGRMLNLSNVAPLNGGFMITSMIGFIISATYVANASAKWGFTFAIFFVLMFVASLISMTYGPDEAMLQVKHGRSNISKIK